MSNYYDDYDLGSTVFDKQFERIEGLTWLPWVGHNYMNSERRVLVVAESHYVNGDSENIELLKDQTVEDRLTTRGCVAECPIGNKWQNNMYDNLHRCLFGRSDLHGFDGETLWNNLAFYNFIQKPMDYTGDECEKERPLWSDFYDGWRIFLEVVKIIKPTDCLFVGVSASNTFNQYMSDHNLEYSSVEHFDVNSNVNGRRHSITIGENTLQIVGIKHTSHHFSWEKWNQFLMEKAPLMVGYLNDLVYDSLWSSDLEVRHNIMSRLKRHGFNLYYAVGEKDIMFSEDDMLGWMKTWVTLGRLRDDKQLDSVTIGCYGDEVLLVETGIRKNPDMDLADTVNNEWWTEFNSKNFYLSDSTENEILDWLEENVCFQLPLPE